MTYCQTIWVEGRRPYVVKLALREAANLRLKEGANALVAVGRITAPDVPLAGVIPKVHHTGLFDGRFYSIETALPGKNAVEYLASPAARAEIASQGLRFLLRLQTLSRDDTLLDLETWNRRFQPMIDAVGAFAKPHDPSGVYGRIDRHIRDQLLDQRVPLGFAHGNFWIGNLVVDTNRELTGVIDWDSAVDGGLPLIDLLYLLVRTQSLVEDTSLGAAVTKWIASDLEPLVGHPLVGEYCREFSVPMTLLRPLFYFCWIQHLNAHVHYRTPALARPDWLRENLINVLSGVNRLERW